MIASPKNIEQKAMKILASNKKLRFHPEKFYQSLVGLYKWKKNHAIYATLRVCSYAMFDYAGENAKKLGPIKIDRIKKFIKFTEEHTSYPQIMFRTFFHLSGLLRSKLRLIERIKLITKGAAR